MRKKRSNQGLTVQAVAGTYVVLLGWTMDEADCDGLMGFALHRTDHTEDEAYWMEGLKTFQATDPGLPPGAKYSTRKHPVQGFTWSDFSAKPGHDYTYRVIALKGTPEDLQPAAEVSLRIRTEAPEDGTHDIYFNRGAAASQEYARRFGNRSPEKVGDAAKRWLSRGLYEAITGFIARAEGPRHGLRVCAYEFHYPGVLQALREARDLGADVRIIYDRRKDVPGERNDEAVAAAGLEDLCTRRQEGRSAISHNKFIVLLEEGEPQAVMTGGTNFSEGGIFGHSNALHIVEEPDVARAYLRYWELLRDDPRSSDLRPILSGEYLIPGDGIPAEGTATLFSPRSSLDALEWYAALAGKARDALFATFAFGMHSSFQNVYRTGRAGLRYALMEKPTRPMKEGPARDAEEEAIRQLRLQPENRFAIGSHFEMNLFDRWLGERLSDMNRNVRYVHTKYMLIDPLGPDPVVVAGSANFSAASTNENDENMLVIRGDTRVADIYLGEFMRLYNHHAFREWASRQPAGASATPQHLRTDDWWREYFGGSDRSRQREYFAGV